MLPFLFFSNSIFSLMNNSFNCSFSSYWMEYAHPFGIISLLLTCVLMWTHEAEIYFIFPGYFGLWFPLVSILSRLSYEPRWSFPFYASNLLLGNTSSFWTSISFECGF
uniref:NADH dehydrogenase subunit 3 n=1 Tax=Kudoa septempunctata TaxID=751907 RepID=A0A0H5AY35_9CNID|nr:NADH dehydrogenase subunit 3 [Kudoa septempunctata]